jgi:dTDP-4-dehydrorhamnose reductase
MSTTLVTLALRALARGEQVVAVEDERVSPTYVPDLGQASLDLLIDGESGIWHLANQGALSWAELARQAARLARFDPTGVVGVSRKSLGCAASRPRTSVLGSARGLLLPTLDQALGRFLADRAR